MKRTILALVAAGLLGGAVLGLSGCYASSASVGVGVEAAPPAPVSVYYDSRPGYSWIEGRWVWSSYGWQWYPGYWVAARPGYIYMQGYWDYWGGRYVYRPGSWARYRNGQVYVAGRWHTHRPGHYYNVRRGTWSRAGGARWGARSGPGYHTGGGARGPTYRQSPSYGRPGPGPSVHEHRGGGGGGGGRRHDRR
jgi:hypothetical protein